MSEKEVAFKDKAREALKNGVDLLANAVKVTLGAKGRYVVFRGKDGKPHPTKDGVTVAEEITPIDPLEKLGSDLMKQVSAEAAKEAGDGTTTATVLAQAMVNEGYRYVTVGANPIDLKRGIDKAVKEVVKILDIMAKNVNIKDGTIKQVAVISSNGDDTIGDIVSTAYQHVGEKGMVTVDFSTNSDTYAEMIEGVKVEKGFALPHFITNPATKESVLENPLILIYDDKIESFTRELTPILTEIGQSGRSVLIIANDYDPEVLHTIAANKIRNILKVNAIKAPNFGELNLEVLNDIAVATGAKVISKKAGMSLSETFITDLGEAERVISDYNETFIIGGHANDEELQKYLENLYQMKDTDKYAAERASRLLGGISIIKVGGTTDAEAKEKKDRVDDAVAAVKSAISEGIVIGGGAVLVRIAASLNVTTDNEDEELGVRIVKKALETPLKTIVDNSGQSGEVALHMVKNNDNMNVGYDVVNQELTDMFTAGIIDPKKVTRIALESAASVAGIILTTDCVIGQY